MEAPAQTETFCQRLVGAASVRPDKVAMMVIEPDVRLIYFVARLLFRVEVKGREVIEQLDPPYLICPNHQSYLDPFLVCSTYPCFVLQCAGDHD
jgi:hypothetical protein